VYFQKQNHLLRKFSWIQRLLVTNNLISRIHLKISMMHFDCIIMAECSSAESRFWSQNWSFYSHFQNLIAFRSTLGQSWPDKAGLKCPSVRSFVCMSTKRLFDFNEIWHVGRCWWVMHNCMQCDPIQGQGQGHEPFNVGNLAIFKSYVLRHLQWELATDHGFLN